jgi:hypothetical protein
MLKNHKQSQKQLSHQNDLKIKQKSHTNVRAGF